LLRQGQAGFFVRAYGQNPGSRLAPGDVSMTPRCLLLNDGFKPFAIQQVQQFQRCSRGLFWVSFSYNYLQNISFSRCKCPFVIARENPLFRQLFPLNTHRRRQTFACGYAGLRLSSFNFGVGRLCNAHTPRYLFLRQPQMLTPCADKRHSAKGGHFDHFMRQRYLYIRAGICAFHEFQVVSIRNNCKGGL